MLKGAKEAAAKKMAAAQAESTRKRQREEAKAAAADAEVEAAAAARAEQEERGEQPTAASTGRLARAFGLNAIQQRAVAAMAGLEAPYRARRWRTIVVTYAWMHMHMHRCICMHASPRTMHTCMHAALGGGLAVRRDYTSV
jgi:hypothetical protein